MVLSRILRAGEGKTLKTLRKTVVEVSDLESSVIDLTDAQLRAKTEELRRRYDEMREVDEDDEEATDFDALEIVEKAGRRRRTADINAVEIERDGRIRQGVAVEIADAAQIPERIWACRSRHLQRRHQGKKHRAYKRDGQSEENDDAVNAHFVQARHILRTNGAQ